MRKNMKDSQISLAGRTGLGRGIGNSHSNMSRRATTIATSAATVPGKRIPSTNLSSIAAGSTATTTTTTATVASNNDINHPAVVASLQSSSLIGKQLSVNNATATNSTKTSSPSTAAPITPSIPATNSNNNPSYNSMALSPCRQYGVMAYKDTIQIIQITPHDGIILLYIFPVTPYFQQQQSQQMQQQQQQQKYTPVEVTINRYNTSTGSSHATTTSRTGSISTVASSSTNFLNLRDFALGSVNHRNSNTSNNLTSTNNTNMSMQQGVAAMDVTITHLAWSPGSSTVQPPKQQSDNFRSDHVTTPSNNNFYYNNNNSERTADSDSTSHRREYDSDDTHHNNNNNVSSYHDDDEETKKIQQEYALRTSMIAAAGSNGMIVIWNVGALFQAMGILPLPAVSNPTSATTTMSQQSKSSLSMQSTTLVTTRPLAILHHHTRQVNTLRWHPMRDGVLLSGSQDWTVILWERRKAVCEPDANIVVSIRSNDSSNSNLNMNNLSLTQAQQQPGIKGFFSGFSNSNLSNKQKPNINGSQQYRNQQQQQPIIQQQQTYQWHCRTIYSPKSEAIREVKWSPFYLDVFALVTNSGSLIVYHQDISARTIIRTTAHSGDASTLDWHPTRRNVLATGGDRSVKIWDFEREFERELSSLHHLNFSKDEILSNMERNANTGNSRGESIGTNDSSTVAGTERTESPFVTVGASATYGARTLSSVSSGGNMSQRRKFNILHVLSISASVSRIRWRPVANITARDGEDRHDAMIAVATAPIKGANAGGAGTLSLWSFHRPYMPLSVVEGHRDGTVVDFDWLDTPQPSYGRVRPNFHFGDLSIYETSGPAQLWQHIISVGRDGYCLIQSLVRGDRPISRVPSTCFAMANLSPFQKGYGSLQLFSVCQPVPSGPDADILLTGLRRDIVTANAPGIFREPSDDNGNSIEVTSAKWRTGARIPEEPPKIVFNVIDQGDLDDDSNPIDDAYGFGPKQIIVAPEVVHLSRFAERYKMYTDSDCPTRSALCQHNAEAADSMSQSELANMWRILSMILESCALHDNDEANHSDLSVINEMMRTVYLPSVKELLEERADAGDVQTCVVICEVFEMIRSDQTLLISTLPIELIREWYLSYIDILRDMCLFSHATYLIKNCHDPFIGALNQQSTTIYEACQNCGKEISNDVDNSKGDAMSKSISRRKCKRCRNRVGFCFICHEPVKGVYVWCPGCGHGGHLDHALQWFGSSINSGNNGDANKSNVLRNMCPTGCGHLCNSLREVSAFPRTESFL